MLTLAIAAVLIAMAGTFVRHETVMVLVPGYTTWSNFFERVWPRLWITASITCSFVLGATELLRNEAIDVEAAHRADLDRSTLEWKLLAARLEVLRAQVEPHFLFNAEHRPESLRNRSGSGTDHAGELGALPAGGVAPSAIRWGTTFNFWRPVTAIHFYDPNSTWQEFGFPTPPTRDYTSGHSREGGAAAAVMRTVFEVPRTHARCLTSIGDRIRKGSGCPDPAPLQ